MSANPPKAYCSPKKVKRITEWIDDLHSHYSRELAPSEPPTSERELSQIGSSHYAISERFPPRGTKIPKARSSHASCSKTSSKKAFSHQFPNNLSPGSDDAEKPQDAASKKASAGGSSAGHRPSKPLPSTERSPQRMPSQKAPSAPVSLGPLQHPHSRHRTYISSHPGLDPYSTALDGVLFHEHRQIEDRARVFLRRQQRESYEQYSSRINGRLSQLDDKLVDLDMKWQMLEMEKAAGLRD